ncbi:P-loop containing nucleoside triphosphate hydrolase protein [Ascodesmis nigricans]|uniref:P-loop containing nucleoside triphosphate hydrolase protein n=1 Tax=Ascodesmis nigricans TaxID=341454 RepID=A0A4S2N407_9PEZI|nr:P-loop containing nucleoside triphosphate hydrolase protein [Ascodesmis nigricans]
MPATRSNKRNAPNSASAPPSKKPRAPRKPAQQKPTLQVNSQHDDSSPLSVPQSVPKKPRASRKARKPTTPDDDSPPSIPITPTIIPWPDHFKHLERVHRALNIVYTFCCLRKNLATTFETLKSAVEAHIKPHALTITDIAQIKFLVPRSISFEFVDEDALQVYVAAISGGSGGEDRNDGLRMKPIQKLKEKQVLLFEFVDGDLSRSVVRQINDAADFGSFREETARAKKEPAASTAMMTRLIEKRNDKFKSAVNAFLNQCAAEGVNAVESLETGFLQHVPTEKISQVASVNGAALPPEIPKERKSIAEIIEEIKQSNFYVDQIVKDGHRVFPPQEAKYGDLDFVMSQELVNALYSAMNIERLYSHQAEAINNLHAGHHVIVSTSTSSGKTLIYQIPVLHELQKDRDTKAMFIFPTKALAQDQKRSLIDVMEYMTDVLGDLRVNTFDGDTPSEDRQAIREESSVIFTNPDTLHMSILPHESHWRSFLQNLKFVVVDELHMYNGLFGTHVAFIMRRLRRICSALGNNKIRFVSCSATVSNPEEHMKTIFGIDEVKLTHIDGSPSGKKEFVCWNTPYKDPKDATSGRGHFIEEAAKVFVQLILRGVRTISFCRVRNVCELMLQAVKTELQRLEKPDVVAKVMAYRGGYTPQDRRRIEKEMFDGALMGVIATTALEVGVDIGSLDAVVIVNFPYNISNLRQQSGRAGRRNKDSLTVLVAGGFPIDQHYMSNPSALFTKPNATISIDLSNPMILESHLQCAAYEMPILPSQDTIYFGDMIHELSSTRLTKDSTGFYHCHDSFRPYPSSHVSIRDSENDHYTLIDITNHRNAILEQIEPSRAIFTIYDDAIFLHQGLSYLIRDVNHNTRIARLEAVKVDWTTRPRDFTDVDAIETECVRQIKSSSSCKAYFGKIRITSVVFGYFKFDRKGRILDAVEVDSPPLVIDAKGFWLDIPTTALEILKSKHMHIAAAIHAAEHAILSLLPAFIVSNADGADVRTECKAPEKEFSKRETARKRPARLTFYDAKGGKEGSGVSRKAFEFVGSVLENAVKRIEVCPCKEGCPECVAGARCNEKNAVLSKTGAAVILRCLLGWKVSVEELEDEGVERIETVVPAMVVAPARGKEVEIIEIDN